MHLLFDLDGTITDSSYGIVNSIQYAIQQMALPPVADRRLTALIGAPLKQIFAEMTGPVDEATLDRAVAHYREYFTASGIRENHLYNGIAEALENLKSRGGTLHLATAKPRVFAAQILTQHHLAPLFTTINGSELDGTRTNKSELITYLLQQHHIPAAGSMMIGDRYHDILGAKNNRLLPIGVTWGYGSARELSNAGAEQLLSQPVELSGLIPII